LLVIDAGFVTETSLRERMEGCLHMPPTYDTVVCRAQLALVCTGTVLPCIVAVLLCTTVVLLCKCHSAVWIYDTVFCRAELVFVCALMLRLFSSIDKTMNFG